ncbi:MAG: hypothetical protein JNL29_04685 [Nitrospira sp.]|nr:hypothetical protein [Nitrospira sp.]
MTTPAKTIDYDVRTPQLCESNVGQIVMRHQHHATTEIYVKEMPRLLEGAADAVTQI